jgi:hypothetical protein
MAEKALDTTKRALGLEIRPDAVITSLAPPEQTLLPFLKTSVDDERLWRRTEVAPRLRFDKLNVITQRGGRPRFPNLETIEAVVNPRTELPYKIVTPWKAGAPPIAPFPSVAEEERQLRSLGERFVALLDAEPDVDFYNALKQVEATGVVAPKEAKQVIAYLVSHHTRRYSPRPVWIIQTRGVELVMEGYAAQADIPIDARNHMRHVVDATTGDWLYSDTVPQPVD